jgi:hypothetical protein
VPACVYDTKLYIKLFPLNQNVASCRCKALIHVVCRPKQHCAWWELPLIQMFYTKNLSLSETYYLQGFVAARLVGKADIFTASKYGYTSLIGDHFVVDAACIRQQDTS